jgi:exodeoxyribonuclease VII small subunit
MENFEQKIKKAKELLDKLNNPEITLYEGMQIYKKGIKEIEEASKILQKAKLEYEEIKG